MNEEDNKFLKLIEVINSEQDLYDSLVVELYNTFNTEIIDITMFKARLIKEINTIECTTPKDGPTSSTFENFQELFKELQNVPHKLQSQKKQKDQRLNTTFSQKKEFLKESECSENLTINTTSNLIKVKSHLNLEDIFKNFSNCKITAGNIIKKLKANATQFQTYNLEMGKVKKFIDELKVMKIRDLEKQSNENGFTNEEEQMLDDFVQAIKQCIFINHNQNLFANIGGDHKSIDNLNILMDIVNDLLKNVIT